MISLMVAVMMTIAMVGVMMIRIESLSMMW
jgi:hypothetical protein